MTKKEIFKAAHRIARQSKSNNPSRSYREHLANALKTAWIDSKYPSLEEIARRVRAFDARISTFVEGGTIIGTFRGKRDEDYKYQAGRGLVFNNEGPNVRRAFEKSLS